MALSESELNALVKEATERFNSLPAEQQAAHWRAQRKSWVIGNMLLDHPEMTREHVQKIYDSLGM